MREPYVPIRLSEELLREIDAICLKTSTSRSAFIRSAVVGALAHRERSRRANARKRKPVADKANG